MTDQKAKTPRCRACGHIAHEQNECRVCAGCDDGRPMPGQAETPPAVFLCQVCDQTPERGHAPDCPGATPPPAIALALGVITTDMMHAAEPAETPPLLTPLLHKLWSWAVGRDGYVKTDWMDLQCHLRAQAAALRTAEQERTALVDHIKFYLGADWGKPEGGEHERTFLIAAVNHLGGIARDYNEVARHTEELRRRAQRAELDLADSSAKLSQAEREAAALREERDKADGGRELEAQSMTEDTATFLWWFCVGLAVAAVLAAVFVISVMTRRRRW